MRCRPLVARTNQWFVLEIGLAANFFMMKCRPVAAERKGMYKAGLVLEGGGMKGIYTAGVLDFFLDKGIEFSSCYGVSAGACHLCSYLSKQRGRAYDISVDYLKDRNYCSVSSLLRTGDLFGVKMCYDDIPNRLNPYDYDTFNTYQEERLPS